MTFDLTMYDLITVKEAATQLTISRDTIYRHIRKKAIPIIRMGPRSIRIKQSVINEILNGDLNSLH